MAIRITSACPIALAVRIAERRVSLSGVDLSFRHRVTSEDSGPPVPVSMLKPIADTWVALTRTQAVRTQRWQSRHFGEFPDVFSSTAVQLN